MLLIELSRTACTIKYEKETERDRICSYTNRVMRLMTLGVSKGV